MIEKPLNVLSLLFFGNNAFDQNHIFEANESSAFTIVDDLLHSVGKFFKKVGSFLLFYFGRLHMLRACPNI